MEMQHCSARLLALIGLLVVGVVPAWAADCGDTAGPGGTDVPCSCGDTVVTSTVLNSTDPVLSAGPADVCPGDGLHVGASGIVLSLGGKTIRGSGTGTGVSLIGHDDVSIKQGYVIGFDYGVWVEAGHGNFVGNVTAEDIGTYAIYLLSASGDAVNGVPGNSVSGNVVTGNPLGTPEGGVVLTDSDENTIEKNRITSARYWGIALGSGNRNVIRNNQVFKSGSGITLCTGDDNMLNANRLGNAATTGNGIGIWLPDPGVGCTSTGNVLSLNIADYNLGDGLLIESDGNTLLGNRGKRNGDDGLDIRGAGNEVDYNVFDQNADWGICAAPGNFDSGGNRASRNGSGNISWACP